MFTNLKNVLVCEDGATLVEYALVVSLIAVACIAIVGALGTQIKNSFTAISAAMKAA